MRPGASDSWTKGLFPFMGIATFTIGLLAFAWKQGDALNDWAAQPHVTWNLVGLSLYAASVLLSLRTYSQLRNPRLYALVFLLVPLGVVHFFHYSNPASSPELQRVSGGPRLSVSKLQAHGSRPPLGPREAPQQRRVSTFVGLPDSYAKSNPELPAKLNRLFTRLHGFSFLIFPLLVLAATFLSFKLTSKRVRIASLTLILGELALGAAFLALGPEDLRALSNAPTLIAISYCAAGVAALVFWRSPAGVGGSVAGLLIYMFPTAMASAGLDPGDLGLAIKRLPVGPERVCMMLFSSVLTFAVGREWIVSMKHTTQTDALTQIFNKAYAESILNQTGREELGSIYSVALLDIDHFKKVNDTYGHFAGDEVLREVCRTIQETIHNRGLVCRTGGEEITVFFPGLEVEEARGICEEVREAVAALEIPTTDNSGKKVKLSVTLSLGVATNRDLESGAELHGGVREVVDAADRAVYSAKASGRNRVIVD